MQFIIYIREKMQSDDVKWKQQDTIGQSIRKVEKNITVRLRGVRALHFPSFQQIAPKVPQRNQPPFFQIQIQLLWVFEKWMRKKEIIRIDLEVTMIKH